MKRSLHKILLCLLVFLPAMMFLAQARGQGDTVCVGEVSTWVVEQMPGDTYTWELYNDVTGINLAVVPGNCPPTEAYFVGGVNTGDSVNVMCLVPGTYFIKVTAVNSCPTNNLKVGKIVVEECYSYAELLPIDPVCAGDTAQLEFEISGAPGPWVITYTDGTNVWTSDTIYSSPCTVDLDPTPTTAGSYNYWILSVSNPFMTNNTPGDPVTLIVKPKPVTSAIIRYTP